MRYYAGIGSRTCPAEMCAVLTQFAWHLEKAGFILRSGGAEGADKAFEAGVQNPENKIIFKSSDSQPYAEEVASRIHPAWERCNQYARQCHGRNVMQVLGYDLHEPAELVVAWTPGGHEIGGSRTVLVLAQEHKIPIYNLGREGEEARLLKFLYPDGIRKLGH